MEYATYVSHVRADGQLLAGRSAGHLSEPVPSCPGWSSGDLVKHVAEVYEHKIACTELGREPEPWPPRWPADRDPIEWFADAHGRLLAMFRAHRPEDPSATWWPTDQSVGFWARRMAHETAVHRVDAELATGEATPVDADLAVDGVDEILNVMLAGDWSEAPSNEAHGQTVTVSTGGRGWAVTLNPASVDVSEAGSRPGAVTISGEPTDVLLWLWGREADDRVTRVGDASAFELFRGRLRLATQ